MKLIGLTGGIATGKSSAAKMFENLGAHIIDFDVLSRKIVEPGSRGLCEIEKMFGSAVISTDGKLDRRALSDIVFDDSRKREQLESITHPLIQKAFEDEVGRIRNKYDNPVIIAVIPLLFEVHMADRFDKIILVYAPLETQLLRLMKRDGFSKEKAMSVINSQLPIDKKRDLSDYIINNQHTLKEAEKDVFSVFQKLNQNK